MTRERMAKYKYSLERANLMPLYHTSLVMSINMSLAIGTLVHARLPLIQSTVGIFLTVTARLRNWNVLLPSQNKRNILVLSILGCFIYVYFMHCAVRYGTA